MRIIGISVRIMVKRGVCVSLRGRRPLINTRVGNYLASREGEKLLRQFPIANTSSVDAIKRERERERGRGRARGGGGVKKDVVSTTSVKLTEIDGR
jgi:hypothetical protein